MSYILEFKGQPLGTFTSKAEAYKTMRRKVYNWRYRGLFPFHDDSGENAIGRVGYSGCTAPIRHDYDDDDKAVGGTYYYLKYKGAWKGNLRVVRAEEKKRG